MKLKLTLPAVVLAAAAPAAFALTTGDIAFTGLNCDGTDALSFVAIAEIPAGTVIYFTDEEWNGTDWAEATEHAFSWTATTTVAPGSIVSFSDCSNIFTGTATASSGTLASISDANNNAGFGNADEAIFAFLSTGAVNANGVPVPTGFLAVIGNDTLAGTLNVLTGTGLVEGTSALFIAGDEDIMAYIGPRNGQAAFANYLTPLTNSVNWVTQDASGDQSSDTTAPDVPFSSAPFVLGGSAPETLSVSLLATSIPETGGSTTATVSRTGPTTLELAVNLASSDTTEATVPATALIPAGAPSVDVPVTAVGDTLWDNSQSVTITATQTGYFDGGAVLTVTDDTLGTDVPLLTITEIHHTPDSDVNGDGIGDSEDEYVELVNTSGGPLDVSGWTVSDVGALRHTFAPGTILDPNAAVLIFSSLPSSPAAIGGALAIATSTGNLGIAAGDSVVVRNASNGEVHRVDYTSVATSPSQSLNLSGEPAPSAYVNHSSVAGAVAVISPGTKADGTPWTVSATLTLAISPATFLENSGVQVNAGTITTSTAPLADLTVNLVSNDITEATVPATVTILANTTSSAFSVTAVDDFVVDSDQPVIIGATASGHLPANFNVTVQNDEVPPTPHLTTGDIAFTVFNADGNDDMAFAALTAIPAGEEIYFSDNEWNGQPIGTGGAFVDSNESEWKWTAPAGGVSAGTIITLTNLRTAIAANVGTVALVSGPAPDFSAGSETVFAFQGAPAAPVHFLASIANHPGDTLQGTNLNGAPPSELPGVLNTAVFLTTSTDGAEYTGPRGSQGSFPGYLALIANPANWQMEPTDGTLIFPLDTTPFTLLSGFGAWASENGIPGALSTVDSDGDGLINLVEYFFNQNPANGGDFANMPQLVRNGGALELDFTRLTDVPDATGTLEFSGDLTTWTDALPGIDYTVASSVVSGDETAVTYALPGTGPSAPGTSPTYLTPNSSDPAGASLGGVRVVNEGLVGVGRLSGESLDKFGETQGAASGLFITDWAYASGQFSGTFHVLPDRGHGDGTSNYAARLHEVDFTFAPYYGTTAVAQGQVALTYADSTKFKYLDGTTEKFTTGLNPTGTSTLFGQTVGTITTANGPGGNQESLLSFDAEAIHLFDDGSGFVSDEYGTYIARFNAAKLITGLTQLPEAARPYKNSLLNFDSVAAPNTGRRNNQGLEGMSVTPDGTRLFALLQSSTVQDSNSPTTANQQTRNHARLFVYDIAGANRENPILTGEYVVRLPQIDLDPITAPSALNGTAAQSEIVALGQSSFLMLPRDGNGLGKGTTVPITFKSVQLVDFASATDILGMFDGVGQAVSPGGVLTPGVKAAAAAEVINMLHSDDLAKFGLNTTLPANANTLNEKIEGMALVPDVSTEQANDFFLFVANDNDFQSSDVKMLNAAGNVVSKGDGRLNAGITNDAMFYVWRLTIDAGGKKFFRMDVTENN